MKLIIAMTLITMTLQINAQDSDTHVSVNGMEVNWRHQKNKIIFEVKAPTEGWVTVGFNETQAITGAYLLMGRVREMQPEVVEHVTLSPGNYKPISKKNDQCRLTVIEGKETKNSTNITFSVESGPDCQYQKILKKGMSYWMVLAYSVDDDFQHHSIMRTAVRVVL